MSKRVKHTTVEVVEPSVSQPTDSLVGKVQTEDEKDLALESKVIDVVAAHTEVPGVHADLERSEKEEAKTKKGKAGKKGESAKDSTPTETKVETPKPTCAQCRFWDASTLRAFHRDGIRAGLTEQRAICRAPKDVTKASGHLVMDTSTRPCNQPGTYVKPAKVVKEKKVKEQPAKTETETKTVETQTQTRPETKTKKTSKKHRETTERAVAVNSLSGDTKVLQKKNGTNKVVVKEVGQA
jgi:hypothetical protein